MSQTQPILALAAMTAGITLAGLASPTEARTILIDFGSPGQQTTVDGWNQMLMTQENQADIPPINDLVDSDNVPTGYSVAVTDAFAFTNEDGVGSPNQGGTPTGAAITFPNTATGDNWYINPSLDGFAQDSLGQLTFSNLTLGQAYSFGFFASRMGAPGANRETDYTINGETVTLNADMNTGTMVWIYDVLPDASGNIVVDVTKNSSGGSFGYLGVIQIETVPEPASLGLLSLGGLALLGRRRAARAQ